MGINHSSSKDSQESENHGKENLYCLSEHINHYKQIAGGNMSTKDIADEGSKQNENHVIGNWRKGEPCCIVAENLAELFPTALWKAEPVNSEAGYVPRYLSRQTIDGVTSIILAA